MALSFILEKSRIHLYGVQYTSELHRHYTVNETAFSSVFYTYIQVHLFEAALSLDWWKMNIILLMFC